MAFAPRQPAPCYVLLFLCIAAWGSYAPLRRTSKSIAGSTFGTLAFLAELTWACTACFVGGSLGGDRGGGGGGGGGDVFDGEADFFQRLYTDVAGDPNAAMLVVLGGALVGFGDSVSFTVLSYVPSSLAFPLVVGTCTAVGTTVSFFVDVDGSAKPALLFSGIVLLLPSVGLLSYAQSLPPKSTGSDKNSNAGTGADGAGAVAADGGIAIELAERKNTADDESVPAISASPATTTPRWKWIVLLIVIGTINAMWGPLSTVGRRRCSVHSAYFLLSMGRIGIQPLSQSLTQLCVFRKSPWHLLCECWNTPRRDKLCAFACGLLIGIGYYTYFVGSNVVNKSASFAISNCSPLWTIFIGVCVQRDLKHYQRKAKVAVLASAVCFIIAVALLSLSGT